MTEYERPLSYALGMIFKVSAAWVYSFFIANRIRGSRKRDSRTDTEQIETLSIEKQRLRFRILDYTHTIQPPEHALAHYKLLQKIYYFKRNTFRVIAYSYFLWIVMVFLSVFRVPFISSIASVLVLLWFLFILIFPIARRIKLSRRVRSFENKKLLILRTFGFMPNTRYLFRTLTLYWRMLGTIFTVGDKTYARIEYGAFTLGWRWPVTYFYLFATTLSAIVTYLLFQAVFNHYYLGETSAFIVLSVMDLMIALFFAVIFFYFYTKKIIIEKPEKLQRIFNKKSNSKRQADSHFKDIRLYCGKNLWKDAMAKYAQESDAILMDIRNYTASKSGVTYEIRYLLNNIDLRKVVFLADQKNDLDFFQRRCNQLLTSEDPVNVPEIVVYVMGINNVSPKQDAPRIIKLLIAALS